MKCKITSSGKKALKGKAYFQTHGVSVSNFQRMSLNSKFGSLVFYGQCELFSSIYLDPLYCINSPNPLYNLFGGTPDMAFIA